MDFMLSGVFAVLSIATGRKVPGKPTQWGASIGFALLAAVFAIIGASE